MQKEIGQINFKHLLFISIGTNIIILRYKQYKIIDILYAMFLY